MAILTIDRATWRRGGDNTTTGERTRRRMLQGSTYLRNNQGFMCCLGFDAVAMGVSPEQILDVGEPSELVDGDTIDVEDLPPCYLNSPRFGEHPREHPEDRPEYYEASIVREAIAINDDAGITDEEREMELRPILKQLGWEDVVFVGEYPTESVELDDVD